MLKVNDCRLEFCGGGGSMVMGMGLVGLQGMIPLVRWLIPPPVPLRHHDASGNIQEESVLCFMVAEA